VIDGAGHGPQAALASQIARESLEASADRPLVESLKMCHEVLLGTRGAVISLLQVKENSIEFAGVGNVEGRLFGAERVVYFAPDRGLLGVMVPAVRPQEMQLPPRWSIVMFTDGVNQRFANVLDPLGEESDPQAYVDQVVVAWGSPSDDSTLLLLLPDE